MSASLVGSEMCIRDRCDGRAAMAESPRGRGRTTSTEAHWGLLTAAPTRAVSYTHLTLPTICSV
eukprot:844085-Alexandrium_andersonii.AAC.1